MLADRIVLVGTDAQVACLLQPGQAQRTVGGRQQHPADARQRADPFELLLALGREGGGEQPLIRLFEHLLVDAIPGKAQGQLVADIRAAEHLAHDVGVDAVDARVGGVVLAVLGHVEWWKILGQQHDSVVVRQRGVRMSAEQQQDDGNDSLEHGSLPSSRFPGPPLREPEPGAVQSKMRTSEAPRRQRLSAR